MKKRKIILILLTIAVFASVLIIKNYLRQKKITKPDFTIVLKESIYIEYGVDVYRDDTLLNIIESHVIDELKSEVPSNATYEYEIDNSKASFNYLDRAKALEWDKEGTEMFPGRLSNGAIPSFYYSAANSKAYMDALTSKNTQYGLEEIKPLNGNFIITIGEYSERIYFDYYVVDLEIN